MKYIVRILLVLVILDFAVGFIIQQEHPVWGNKIVGTGVLVFAFVLIPLFLYMRYRNKKIEDYTLDKERIDEIIDNLKL